MPVPSGQAQPVSPHSPRQPGVPLHPHSQALLGSLALPRRPDAGRASVEPPRVIAVHVANRPPQFAPGGGPNHAPSPPILY